MRRNLKMQIHLINIKNNEFQTVERLQNSGNCEGLINMSDQPESVDNKDGVGKLSRQILKVLQDNKLVADNDKLIDIKIRIQN